MNTPGLRFVGAALLVLVGIWAGLKFHTVRTSCTTPAVAVPAGVASAPESQRKIPASAQNRRTRAPTHYSSQFAAIFAQGFGRQTHASLLLARQVPGDQLLGDLVCPCRREIPLLKTLAADWAGRELEVIGIAVDYPDKVRQFAAQLKIDYPVLVGEQDALDVAADFGMASPAFPFTVFTDRRGEVVALYLGELHRPQADLILSEVQNLNQDRVQLPQARKTIAQGLERLAAKHAG